MVKGTIGRRKIPSGLIQTNQLYSTDGAIGSLRYKATAGKYKPKVAHVALEEDQLIKGQGMPKVPEPPKTTASRKRVLEELGTMLAGKKKPRHTSH